MAIELKRAYEEPAATDGYRVLVDRLWPRGVKRKSAQLDDWLKDVAPSDELRHWFHANPSEWGEFRHRYLAELKSLRERLRPLALKARQETVTLVYASSDQQHNNAVVLRQYLQRLTANST
ncbi:MAG: DUF488 family protein [Thiohalomonadaceae bacterium]